MKSNSLSVIYSISKELESINHPDALRIAKEIYDFAQQDSIEIKRILEVLKEGTPWEYIRGYTEFDGNTIHVNSNTLIPRLETLQILDIFKDFNEIKQIYDVGCGSGAIGISLAKRYPHSPITLIDISTEALEIAKRNITENNVSTNTVVLQNDLLNNLEIPENSLIIANLPYIPTREYLQLEKSVKDYEPRLALDGGIDGLDIIKVLLNQILENRNIIGAILEIDPEQDKALSEILSNQSRFKYEFIKDFRGLFRFLKLYL